MSAEVPYVVAAYAVTWIVLGAYAIRLSRLGRRVRADAEVLR